jgi:hypothetical protein
MYFFFRAITRRLNFMCRRFGTHCLFHLHRSCEKEEFTRPMKMEQSVPKRLYIKFRRLGITQKKECMHFLSLITSKILRLIHLLKFFFNAGGFIYIPFRPFISDYVYKHYALSFYDFRGEIKLRFSTYRTGQLDILFSILNSMKCSISIRVILQFRNKMQSVDICNP